MHVLPIPPISASTAGEVLEHQRTGVALLDAELNVVYVNHAFRQLLGVGGMRVQNQPLERIGPGAEPLRSGAQRVLRDQCELSLRAIALARPPGSDLLADVSVSPSAQSGVLVEIHALAPRETAQVPRLSESLRGLAHEVKNPLAGVRGAAQLLKRRVADPELARLAELVIVEADRLAALADRLLRVGGKPHLAPVNIHEVAERARALVAAEAEPTLRLERDYDPSLPNIRGDADRLQQLLLNLLRNACQAGATSVQLRTRAEHNALIGDQPTRLALRLDVSDDGLGVPEELRTTLFMPLVSGRANGTGLGLALAQEIAHEHGGTLDYQSRPGHTVFTLLLPLGGDHG